tara:strand:+ start:4842 stop:5441 length:600 start_codon:yes stop_codon:yes gene_type:complete
MLDSDIGNSILPAVRFYQKEVEHPFNTQKEGRPIFYMADFVRIEIPGNQFSIIDTFAGENHKKQYPIAWARYQNEKRELGDDMDISGTSLRDWPILTAAQVRELKHYHFYTVEQVAASSDDQVSKITMVVGMAGHAFRDKAQNYLKRAKDSSILDSQAEELRKRDAEIEALKQQMQELMAAVKPDEAKKRGRKPAETME